MNRRSAAAPHEIACQQVLQDDGTVFSLQAMVIPGERATGITATGLCQRYLNHIHSSTLALIQPISGPAGIEFRLRWPGVTLLSFHPLETDSGGAVASLRIRGGILVQPSRRDCGQMCFAVETAEHVTRISLQLTGYFPRLLGRPEPSPGRYWLYRLTQALIHRRVTIRFLARLHHELHGCHTPVRVVETDIRAGRPV